MTGKAVTERRSRWSPPPSNSAKSICSSPVRAATAVAKEAAQIEASARSHRRRQLPALPKRRAAGRRPDGSPRRLPCARYDHRQEYRARVALARRDADFRHPVGRRPTRPSPARSTPATIATVESPRMRSWSSPCADRFRQGRHSGGSGTIEAAGRGKRRRSRAPIGAEIAKSRSSRTHPRRRSSCGCRALGSIREHEAIVPLADKLRRARRQPCRGRRRAMPQRLSGRPDRQDRRARGSMCDRDVIGVIQHLAA